MPAGGQTWKDLLRSTFHDVGKEDIARLYSREWRLAKEKLTAEDRAAIEREPKRWKRWFKTANSVLFGLANRLAPARRVVFLVVLACFLLIVFSPSCENEQVEHRHGQDRTVTYRVDFDSGFLTSPPACSCCCSRWSSSTRSTTATSSSSPASSRRA